MTPRVLSHLLERAVRERDLASSRRSRALAARREAQSTLESLLGYRGEHRANGIAAGAAGVAGTRVTLQHRFDLKLGEAIDAQQTRCALLDQTVTVLDGELAAAQRRVHAAETLQRLRSRELDRRRDRAEQRLTDEHAARTARPLHRNRA